MKKSIFTLLTIALLFCNKYADSICNSATFY